MTNPVVRLDSPAGNVLAQLRYGPSTVEDLAKALRLTDNAVRNQLRRLVAANLAVRSGMRPGPSKPSVLYAITRDGQVHFSTLYLPVLSHFLRVAEEQCSDTQLRSLMRDAGKSLSGTFPKPRGSIGNRVRSAARLLTSFGGLVETQEGNGSMIIRSLGCPLAALTSEHSAACQILQGLLADYLSAPVQVCCTRAEEPRCCFEIPC